MRYLLSFAGCALCVTAGIAQPSKKIESDRPGKSQSASVVPLRYLQGELGYENEKTDDDERQIMHPEMVLKYGLLKRVELRVTVPLASQVNEHDHLSESGLQPVHVGIKTLLLKGKGFIPKTSVSTEVGIPCLASHNFAANKYFPLIRLNMQSKPGKNFSIAYNAGAEWDGNEQGATWLYTFCPQLQIGNKWELFAETYAYFQSGENPQHSADAGFGFYLAEDVKWDVSAGIGISSNAPKHFYATGLSFRLK